MLRPPFYSLPYLHGPEGGLRKRQDVQALIKEPEKEELEVSGHPERFCEKRGWATGLGFPPLGSLSRQVALLSSQVIWTPDSRKPCRQVSSFLPPTPLLLSLLLGYLFPLSPLPAHILWGAHTCCTHLPLLWGKDVTFKGSGNQTGLSHRLLTHAPLLLCVPSLPHLLTASPLDNPQEVQVKGHNHAHLLFCLCFPCQEKGVLRSLVQPNNGILCSWLDSPGVFKQDQGKQGVMECSHREDHFEPLWPCNNFASGKKRSSNH